MANYAGGATAVCPFYQHESRYTVTCEGLYDDCVQQVKFNEAADKTAYVAHVCSSFSYRRMCPIARLLEEKWGLREALTPGRAACRSAVRPAFRS